MSKYKFEALIIDEGGWGSKQKVVYVLKVKNPLHNSFSGRYVKEWVDASIDDLLEYTKGME